MLNRELATAQALFNNGKAARKFGISYEANPGHDLPQKRAWAMGWSSGD